MPNYRDAFRSDRYKPQPEQRLYPAQAFNPGMNPDGSGKPWGFGIEAVYAENVNFSGTEDDGWSYCPDYQFKGKTEKQPIHVCQKPSLVMVRRGETQFMEAATKLELGFLRGHPRAEDCYQNKAAYRTFVRHLVFFVGADKRLLHDQPLQFRLGGAASGTFGDEYGRRDHRSGKIVSGFQWDLLNAYWQDQGREPAAPGSPVEAMGEDFFAYWVAYFQCRSQSKGEGSNSSLVCCTVSHGIPTPQNLESFYIDPDSADGEIITQALQRYANFGRQATERTTPTQSRDRPTPVASPHPKQPKPHSTVADSPSVSLSGRLSKLRSIQDPQRGLIVRFDLETGASAAQACYALKALAEKINQLYHNGSYVALTATPLLDRQDNPLLRVETLTASTPKTEPESERESEDMGDLLLSIDLEIKRLGWTKRQGSQYLQDTYGKKTRAELTNAELSEFFKYLAGNFETAKAI